MITGLLDKAAGKLKGRQKNGSNLMIKKELVKLNEISKAYRLSQPPITLEQLLKESYSYTSRLVWRTFVLS